MDGKIALIAGVVFGGVLLAGAVTALKRDPAGSGDPAVVATAAANSGGPVNAVAAPLSSEVVFTARDAEHSESHKESKDSEHERESDDD